jgi:hypothetical protein
MSLTVTYENKTSQQGMAENIIATSYLHMKYVTNIQAKPTTELRSASARNQSRIASF